MIRMALLNQEKDFTNPYNQGIKIGEKQSYEKGKADWSIKISCNICGKDDIFIIPDSEWHTFIVRQSKSHNWGHKAFCG